MSKVVTTNKSKRMPKMPKGMSQEEFEKTMCFTKNHVELHEYKVHKMIYNSKIINVPRIYSYDKKTKTMVMQKIHNMTISDYYGENAEDVPSEVMSEIQEEMRKLYAYGVNYSDITGYNFIKHNNKIYVIDFEHATYSNKNVQNSFMENFINGLCEWNQEFV